MLYRHPEIYKIVNTPAEMSQVEFCATSVLSMHIVCYIYIYIYVCVCVCVCVCMCVCIYIYKGFETSLSLYIYRFQNVFLRCPTPRLHCFLYSHWTSFRFLSFMAFLIPSIQFFFGLPRALFCFGIHCNVILGNFFSAIL